MRVLITGANGHVGMSVLEALADEESLRHLGPLAIPGPIRHPAQQSVTADLEMLDGVVESAQLGGHVRLGGGEGDESLAGEGAEDS